MVSKEDFKNLFQTSMKEMFTKKDNKAKTNAEGDEDSLDMNVFEKLMEGKQPMFVNENNDDLISINDTDTFDYSMQDKNTHESIKLKHEPEKAHENVQYTADIIVEIKNRDDTVVPMRALLDTGTTSTIILIEFVGMGRARTNTKKRTKWKHLVEHSQQTMNHFWISNFPKLALAK
jgi:hypothetical protein